MSPRRGSSSRSGPSWWLVGALALIVLALFYWWQRDFATDWLPARPGAEQARSPYGGPVPPDLLEAPPGEPARAVPPGGSAVGQEADASPPSDGLSTAENRPRYPLPDRPPAPGEAPLPARKDSDGAIREALSRLSSPKALARFGNLGDFTRRFVVTVDNLPREMVPAQYSAARRVPGALTVDEEGGRTVLKPENFERYREFVEFAESLGPKSMVAVYERFYPLLQEEYRALGFPKAHFNDRVVEAIDDMLAAPTPKGPIVLVQPRVQFRFADPALERLSAGQKIMVRIGPENAARLKKVLQEIRRELVQ